jgi:transposase
VAWYGRADISATFASTYRIASSFPIPFGIDYLFEDRAHVYLPDAIGQFLDGTLVIAEAGLEQDKQQARNRAKAEAARKVAEQQGGAYWIGTEATLSKTRHANLVFLHARRQPFPAWSELKELLHVVWPPGEAACVQEVVERLGERWSQAEREAAVWKRCADAAARGHLLVDLATISLTRLTPLICLPTSSPPILPDPLPSELSESPVVMQAEVEEVSPPPVSLSSTFDDSTLEGPERERFLRNLRAVEAVLAGSTVTDAAREHQIARSTLSRLVQRTRRRGVLACVPHATYHRERALHPAFQEVIRRLYVLPTQLSMTAIAEHADLKRVAKRLQEDTGTAVPLPSYHQIRDYVKLLQQEPQASHLREQARGSLRTRQSPSFVCSLDSSSGTIGPGG